MRNYKLEHNLIGPENWLQIPTVFVKEVPAEQEVSPEKSQKENEKFLFLKVTSEKLTEFYVGFYNRVL